MGYFSRKWRARDSGTGLHYEMRHGCAMTFRLSNPGGASAYPSSSEAASGATLDERLFRFKIDHLTEGKAEE